MLAGLRESHECSSVWAALDSIQQGNTLTPCLCLFLSDVVLFLFHFFLLLSSSGRRRVRFDISLISLIFALLVSVRGRVRWMHYGVLSPCLGAVPLVMPVETWRFMGMSDRQRFRTA